jgi:pimeloyl-ACP methyl ester carboxylesterase
MLAVDNRLRALNHGAMIENAVRRIMVISSCALALSGCGDGGVNGRSAACEAPPGTEAFDFESGGQRLVGFIDAPATPGPHPAVLLIHDRGPTDVTKGSGDFPRLREAFRSVGLASVVWDRRGSGCSEGRDRGLADLYLRADDVLAATGALRRRDDIDAEHIGLWALGEGGWVAPMAAARDGEFAFMIVVSGPGKTPSHEAEYFVRSSLEQEGLPQAEEIAQAFERAMAAMADQKGYNAFRNLAKPLTETPFFEPLRNAAPDLFPGAERYEALQESGVLDISTGRFLPALEMPVLAVWGDRDIEVDWRQSIKVYREAFTRGRNAQLDTRVFDDADHWICEAGDGSLEERLGREDCAPVQGYIDTLLAWLRGRGFSAPPD